MVQYHSSTLTMINSRAPFCARTYITSTSTSTCTYENYYLRVHYLSYIWEHRAGHTSDSQINSLSEPAIQCSLSLVSLFISYHFYTRLRSQYNLYTILRSWYNLYTFNRKNEKSVLVVKARALPNIRQILHSQVIVLVYAT